MLHDTPTPAPAPDQTQAPAPPAEPRFTETQRLAQNRLARVVLLCTSIITGLIFLAIGFTSPQPVWTTLIPAWVGIAVVMPAALTRLKMRTEVTDSELIVRWAPFYRKRIPLGDIELGEPVRYRPISDAGGWGIKHSRKFGLVLNVFGDRGVKVTAANKRLLIGSQRPDELASAILQGAVEHNDDALLNGSGSDEPSNNT